MNAKLAYFQVFFFVLAKLWMVFFNRDESTLQVCGRAATLGIYYFMLENNVYNGTNVY